MPMEQKSAYRIACTMLILLVLLVGCTSKTDPEPAKPPDPEPPVVTEPNEPVEPPVEPGEEIEPAGWDEPLSKAQLSFSFNLYKELVKQEEMTTTNLFISPLSIASSLLMTYNGASDTTQQAMAKTLQVGAIDVEQINEGYRSLLEQLSTYEQAGAEVELALANGLFAKQGTELSADFLQINDDYYGAHTAQLDFSSPEATEAIHNWVRQHTQGTIASNADSPLPDSAILYMINAAYFNGSWATAFDKQRTQDKLFISDNGMQTEVPMMAREAEFEYMEDNGVQVIRLPYGDEDLGMIVVLPAPDQHLEDFIAALDAGKWSSWLGKLAPVPGQLEFPRFQIAYDQSMRETLSALGIAEAFDPEQANFEPMIAGSESEEMNSEDSDTTDNSQAGSSNTEASSPTGSNTISRNAEGNHISGSKDVRRNAEDSHMSDSKSASGSAEDDHISDSKSVSGNAEDDHISDSKSVSGSAEDDHISDSKSVSGNVKDSSMSGSKTVSGNVKDSSMSGSKTVSGNAEDDHISDSKSVSGSVVDGNTNGGKDVKTDEALEDNPQDFQGGIALHDIRHKSFIDVQETGTEAAAGTSVQIVDASAQELPDDFTMYVNRPFFFAIEDRSTNTLLFMGSVSQLGKQ
ncbi:hypothetical protein EBB07_05870 [Paenibacillaceae bacterium]|nr:hypothetical protein EBB07_05870 [Paenibacillaceae bacterium]